MNNLGADVTLHISEDTTHDQRENFRDRLLGIDGVMSASYHDEKPHLMVVVYDPGLVKSVEFVDVANIHGLSTQLIAL